MQKRSIIWMAPLLLCAAVAIGPRAVGQASGDTALKETEEGIPVTDPLTVRKCGTCHLPDAKSNLTRISWARSTPEGWNQAIKRMVRQNGLQISPAETRDVVKYLSAQHGLAPEEAKQVMYLAEHRIQDETLIPNEQVHIGCASCHSFAQPLSWRRSKTDWKLLQNLHVALYAQADAQFRRVVPSDPPTAGEPPLPVDVALEWLNKNAPLHTPEWAAWQSRVRTPRLAGKWLISASSPGHGRFVGEMVVAPAGTAEDEFTTTVTLHSLADGSTIQRTGKGIVYAGYSWRGSSSGKGAAGVGSLTSAARETIWFAPDQAHAEGRWFWGEYQEFGFDVKLTRASAAPALVAVEPGMLKAGVTGARVRIIADGLPGGLTPTDLHLGQGVSATQIVSQSPGEIVAMVDVAPSAVSGMRDVEIRGATLENAFPVYRKLDYLAVTPETSLAHLGGDVHAKGYQQFEAVAYENGPDGKPHTPDDLRLGAVPVTWVMQEFISNYADDDIKYVGKLDQNGLFIPNIDGPAPGRRFHRNNYGEVWVTATAKGEKDKFGKPLSGRSFLVATVPTYLRWDQPEVSQ